MACNCTKVTENNTVEQPSLARSINDNPDVWVDVIYGGATYLHYIPSPTGIIREFGLKNYGLGKRGDKLKVHEKELPSLLFTLYVEKTIDNSEEEMNETQSRVVSVSESIVDEIDTNNTDDNSDIDIEVEIDKNKPKRVYKKRK